jgi:hypothetical protein
VSDDGNGNQVDAIDRIGTGPWYDRLGRLVANDVAGLLNTRPQGDAAVRDDLPDETGAPLSALGDAHDIMTGSDVDGRLLVGGGLEPTCQNWTSSNGADGGTAGHSWPAQSGQNWIAAHPLRGCAPGVNLIQDGPGSGDCVGCSGGFGGIYCFALEP